MADKYISVEAMRKRLGIVPDGNCMKCQYGGGIGACMKPVYVEYICGELDKEPAADVVLRSCYDRILAENDAMREQLAAIGKKPGDKMDDVRKMVTCEECDWHVDCGYHYCNKLRQPCPDNAEFFCGYGERPNCGADMREETK